MSLFKKFFQKPEKQKEFINREPRVHSAVLSEVQFLIHGQSGDRPAKIINISSTGIALEVPDGIQLDDHFEGALTLKGKSLKVQLEVKRRGHQVLGCKYVNPHGDFLLDFKKALDLELLGSSLSPIDPSTLNQEEEGTPHWFVDRLGNEVYFLIHQQELRFFYLNFNNLYVEGSAKKIRTGRIDSEISHKIMNNKKEHVRFDENPNADTLTKAKTLVQSLLYANASELGLLLKRLESR